MSTKFKYTLVKKSDIGNAVKECITATTSLRAMIQNTAFSILSHAARHGDYMLEHVNNLCLGVVGMRAELIAQYFSTYGGYTRKPGESEFSAWQGKEFVQEHLEQAKVTMWWDKAKPEDAFKEMLFEKDFLSLLNKYSKAETAARKAELQGENHNTVNLEISQGTFERLLRLAKFDHLLINDSRVVIGAEEPANETSDDMQELAAAVRH